jgi:hypothetical protein
MAKRQAEHTIQRMSTATACHKSEHTHTDHTMSLCCHTRDTNVQALSIRLQPHTCRRCACQCLEERQQQSKQTDDECLQIRACQDRHELMPRPAELGSRRDFKSMSRIVQACAQACASISVHELQRSLGVRTGANMTRVLYTVFPPTLFLYTGLTSSANEGTGGAASPYGASASAISCICSCVRLRRPCSRSKCCKSAHSIEMPKICVHTALSLPMTAAGRR